MKFAYKFYKKYFESINEKFTRAKFKLFSNVSSGVNIRGGYPLII